MAEWNHRMCSAAELIGIPLSNTRTAVPTGDLPSSSSLPRHLLFLPGTRLCLGIYVRHDPKKLKCKHEKVNNSWEADHLVVMSVLQAECLGFDPWPPYMTKLRKRGFSDSHRRWLELHSITSKVRCKHGTTDCERCSVYERTDESIQR